MGQWEAEHHIVDETDVVGSSGLGRGWIHMELRERDGDWLLLFWHVGTCVACPFYADISSTGLHRLDPRPLNPMGSGIMWDLHNFNII